MSKPGYICCIVIPVYKETPDEPEKASFKQCLHVLHTYPIILVVPESLNTSQYETLAAGKLEVQRFNDTYFKDVQGYNRLMLSQQFYKRFAAYRYMLVYQLDAWVFRDELEYWCSKNYDYIGAPWTGHSWAAFAAGHHTFMRTLLYKLGYRKFNLVGNGGLSLRKVKSAVFNLGIFSYSVKKFTGNEDAFFSFYINSYNPFFSIPSSAEALGFSFDIHPEQSFALNNNRLPMGCHAWQKNRAFWQQFIPIP